MQAKDKLNAILRLRLFFPTEKELSHLIGYQLKGNHFNRVRPFVAEMYLSHFAAMCHKMTDRQIALEPLLQQYEATSRFYFRYIKGRTIAREPRAIDHIISYAVLGHANTDETIPAKELAVCEQYAASDRDDFLSPAILLLLSEQLLPSFENKQQQDVDDILGDFSRAYERLMDFAHHNRRGDSTYYNELLCLKEMRDFIDCSQDDREGVNRLTLIYFTSVALQSIFALKQPDKLHDLINQTEVMCFNLRRFWHREGSMDYEFWEFAETPMMMYQLWRYVVDKAAKRICKTSYTLIFKDFGTKEMCYSLIIRPPYAYCCTLGKEMPTDAIAYDYTEIEYAENGRDVAKLSFVDDSPMVGEPMTLVPIEREDQLACCDYYFDSENSEFEIVDESPEYHIDSMMVATAVANDFILFQIGDAVFKLEKWDAEGRETIDGVSQLTHADNYVFSVLDDAGTERCILSLDSIDKHLDFEALLKKDYFYEIEALESVF